MDKCVKTFNEVAHLSGMLAELGEDITLAKRYYCMMLKMIIKQKVAT